MGQTQGKPKSHASVDDQEKQEPTTTARCPPTTAAAAMDTFFLSHGAPTLCIDETIPARSFFQSWQQSGMAGTKPPRAILIVSGHWETDIPTVNVVHGTNDTIYDYGLGYFPQAMYQVRPLLAISSFVFPHVPKQKHVIFL